MREPEKRLSLRLPLAIGGAGFAACACAFLAFGLYLYWNSPKIINFLAAWIPFVLSILFAFVPSVKEMKHRWIRWTWRGGVVVVGFFWSVMLWHQQDLTDEANSKQTQEAIGTAVEDANNHADEKIGGVQRQVETLGKNLGETTKTISSQLGKTETDLADSIGKVGKPEPPELATLQMSLYTETLQEHDYPMLSEKVVADKDGNFPIDIVVKNTSSTAAENVDLWVNVCQACSYAVEPADFQKPPGIDEHVRHVLIPVINPGAMWGKVRIEIKAPSQIPLFVIGVRYSCKACGKMQPEQSASITEQH